MRYDTETLKFSSYKLDKTDLQANKEKENIMHVPLM